jgi:signal transduction histidine kinase
VVVPSPNPSPGAGGRWAFAPALTVAILGLGLVIAAAPSGARAIAGAPAPVGMLTALGLLAGLLPSLPGRASWGRRPAPVAAREVERRSGGLRPDGEVERGLAGPRAAAEAALPFAFAVVLGWGTSAGVLVTAAVTGALVLARGGRLRAGLPDAARLVVAAGAGGALWNALRGPGAVATPAAADLPALAAALVAVVLVGAGLASLTATSAVGTPATPRRPGTAGMPGTPHMAATARTARTPGPASMAHPVARAARRRRGSAGAAAGPRRTWASGRTGASASAALALMAVAPVAWVVAATDLALTPLLLPPAVALSLVTEALANRRRLDEVVEGERARAQAAAEAILATVSHELRAPIAVVLGSLETLSARDGELAPDERRELVAMASRHGRRLKRLAAQLLLAARLEQAEVEPDGDAVADAVRVVGEAERAMELLHPGRQVRLDAAPRALPVRAAPETVLQVLTNLLDNAAKYSPPETPIGVMARRLGSSAVITVSDSGPGVPPEQRERIFERFTQLGSDQDHCGGVGLGLHIARELARSLGGDLVLRPNGQGGDGDRNGHGGRDAGGEPDRNGGRIGDRGTQRRHSHHGRQLVRDGAGGGTGQGACFELRLPLAGGGVTRVAPMADRDPAAEPEPLAAPAGSPRRDHPQPPYHS